MGKSVDWGKDPCCPTNLSLGKLFERPGERREVRGHLVSSADRETLGGPPSLSLSLRGREEGEREREAD